jgi:salicylate hydroxylase
LYFPKRAQIVFPIPFILEIYLKGHKLTARSSSLVQNTLRDGDEFNWILTHKDTEDIKESWFQPGDMEEVRRIIEDCDPRIAAAVKKTKECLDWKICYRDPIPSWVSRSHKIALLGDSCHPHLPTSAQGASQATESAAVLALCLKLAGKENIPLAVSYSENNGR